VDGDCGRSQRVSLGPAARRRTICGMIMRAPVSDLPIVFQDVSAVAGNVTLLESVSLEFATGSPTVIIGPNGAGKTTLLRLAMGLISPSRGRVSWGGREKVAPARRAIVFQRPVMLRRSAAGNIRYALAAAGVPSAARDGRLDEVCTLVGLGGLRGRPARKLSGGEQQRLGLARGCPGARRSLYGPARRRPRS